MTSKSPCTSDVLDCPNLSIEIVKRSISNCLINRSSRSNFSLNSTSETLLCKKDVTNKLNNGKNLNYLAKPPNTLYSQGSSNTSETNKQSLTHQSSNESRTSNGFIKCLVTSDVLSDIKLNLIPTVELGCSQLSDKVIERTKQKYPHDNGKYKNAFEISFVLYLYPDLFQSVLKFITFVTAFKFKNLHFLQINH